MTVINKNEIDDWLENQIFDWGWKLIEESEYTSEWDALICLTEIKRNKINWILN